MSATVARLHCIQCYFNILLVQRVLLCQLTLPHFTLNCFLTSRCVEKCTDIPKQAMIKGQTKICGPIVGTFNSTDSVGCGSEFVSSAQQLRITQIVISSSRIRVEMQKLQEVQVRIIIFCKLSYRTSLPIVNPNVMSTVEPIMVFQILSTQSNSLETHVILVSKFTAIRYLGAIQLLFLFGHLYLIGVYFGKDKRTNFIKIHVQKRSDYILKFYLKTPCLVVNTIGRTYVFSERINKHGHLIILTKSMDVRFSI